MLVFDRVALQIIVRKKREKVTWDMGNIPKTNDATSLYIDFGYQGKLKIHRPVE